MSIQILHPRREFLFHRDDLKRFIQELEDLGLLLEDCVAGQVVLNSSPDTQKLLDVASRWVAGCEALATKFDEEIESLNSLLGAA